MLSETEFFKKVQEALPQFEWRNREEGVIAYVEGKSKMLALAQGGSLNKPCVLGGFLIGTNSFVIKCQDLGKLYVRGFGVVFEDHVLAINKEIGGIDNIKAFYEEILELFEEIWPPEAQHKTSEALRAELEALGQNLTH